MLHVHNDDIAAAIKLCRSYVQTKSSVVREKTSIIPTAKAWKEDQSTDLSTPDRTQLASKVLGEKLVGTIKEVHREPPDVSEMLYTLIVCSGHIYLAILACGGGYSNCSVASYRVGGMQWNFHCPDTSVKIIFQLCMSAR